MHMVYLTQGHEANTQQVTKSDDKHVAYIIKMLLVGPLALWRNDFHCTVCLFAVLIQVMKFCKCSNRPFYSSVLRPLNKINAGGQLALMQPSLPFLCE